MTNKIKKIAKDIKDLALASIAGKSLRRFRAEKEIFEFERYSYGELHAKRSKSSRSYRYAPHSYQFNPYRILSLVTSSCILERENYRTLAGASMMGSYNLLEKIKTSNNNLIPEDEIPQVAKNYAFWDLNRSYASDEYRDGFYQMAMGNAGKLCFCWNQAQNEVAGNIREVKK